MLRYQSLQSRLCHATGLAMHHAALVATLGVTTGLAGCSKNPAVTDANPSDQAKPLVVDAAPSVVQDEPANQSAAVSSPEPELVPPKPPTLDPLQLVDEAGAAFEANDIEGAFDLVRKAYRIAPKEPEVVFLKARLLGELLRFHEAIAILDELADEQPAMKLPIMGQTADWMVRAGQWAAAESRLKSVLSQIPEGAPVAAIVHRSLGQLLLRQGRRHDASKNLRMLCQLGDVQENELRALLCIASPFSGDASDEETDPIGDLGHATNEMGRGEFQAATQRLKSIERPDAAEFSLLGRVYAVQDDFAELKKWAEPNQQNDQDAGEHPGALFARGTLAANAGQHREAIRFFAKAIVADETDRAAYELFAKSLRAIGRDDQADAALKRANLIKRTQALGEAMAGSEDRTREQFVELIRLLKELGRPLESLAWRGVRLAYATPEEMSDEAFRAEMNEINAQRSDAVKTNRGGATREFLLCGVDPDKLAE